MDGRKAVGRRERNERVQDALFSRALPKYLSHVSTEYIVVCGVWSLLSSSDGFPWQSCVCVYFETSDEPHIPVPSFQNHVYP